jgi:hypothetical protein
MDMTKEKCQGKSVACSILTVDASNVKRYDIGAGEDDALCTFCGKWATTGSRCSNRFEAIQCSDPSEIDTHPTSCNGCVGSNGIHEGCDKISFPDGTIAAIDCTWRMND